MKILIVSPGFSGGGAEDIAINSANYYKKCGNDVTFCAFHGKGPAQSRLSSEIKLIVIEATSYFSFARYRGLSDKFFDHTFSFIRHTNISSFIARFCGAIKTKKLHLIEVNTFDQQSELNILSRYWQNILLLFTYNCSDDVIAVSQRVRNQIVRKFLSRKVRVVGNPCVNADQFDELMEIIPISKSGKAKHFVAAGRLHKQKGFMNLIKVFEKHLKEEPECTLTIFGEGSLRRQLEEYIKSNGLSASIFLPGYIEDLTVKLTSYDAFILSSDYEGFGNVIILAFLAGLPCLAKKNTGGPDDLIDASNGILYFTDQDLLNSLKTLELNDYPRKSLWRTAERYSFENICEMYLR